MANQLRQACKLLKFLHLPFMVVDCGDGPEGAFGYNWHAGRFGQGEDAFLDFWSEIKETEDLCDPSSGETFLAGDFGLAGNLAGG